MEHDLFGKPVSTPGSSPRAGFPDHALAAQRLQDAIAQKDRIARAALGEFDDFLGDDRGLWKIGVIETEPAAHIGERTRHGGDRFGLEGFVLIERVNGHRGFKI